jgi:hypothetical protein
VSGANFTNVIGVELGVGSNDPAISGMGTYAPWIAVFVFGLDNPNPVYGGNNNITFTSELEGVQNGDITFINPVLQE